MATGPLASGALAMGKFVKMELDNDNNRDSRDRRLARDIGKQTGRNIVGALI